MKEYIEGDRLEKYLYKKTLPELLDYYDAAIKYDPESDSGLLRNAFAGEDFACYPEDVRQFIIDNCAIM